MNRDQKAAVIDEIAEQIKGSQAVFAVDYRGITVAQAADLRGRLRDVEATFRVVKNSLSERAADEAGTPHLKPLLQGPTALALVRGDPAIVAKTLSDVARALNLLEFKGGIMNGTELTADEVRSIARLPAREILNAQLVGTIAAPITGLVRGLNALIAGLAIQLQAIADQGLVSGEAPAVVAEPEVEAVAAEPEADPAAEPEAEAVAAEPEAEAAAAAEPEAEAPPAEPEAEAVAAAEPEAVAVAAGPEAEAVAAAEPEAVAAAAGPEAEAAAAEPEAEAAAAEPEAEAAAAEPEAAADGQPQAAPDAAGNPEQPEQDAPATGQASDA